MKKIIAFVLIFAFAFSLASCGKTCEQHTDTDSNGMCEVCNQEFTCEHKDENADTICDYCSAPSIGYDLSTLQGMINLFLDCYKNSAPTEVVTEVERKFDGAAYTFNASYVLKTGLYAGKNATVYTEVEDVFRDVDSGSGSDILSPFAQRTYVKEYLQGSGVREIEDGVVGEWKSNGLNFAPTAGSISLDLSAEYIKDATFSSANYKNVLSFTVPYENIDFVFGLSDDGESFIDATDDVTVTITNNGAEITSMSISYTIEADGNVLEQHVTINTVYSYGIYTVQISDK